VPTKPVLPESELLLRVQQRINDGRLTVVVPSSISAGYGTGADVCQVCDLAILADQALYEINDPRNSTQQAFHFACYVIWQRECARPLVPSQR
jgi:hypothetical protein